SPSFVSPAGRYVTMPRNTAALKVEEARTWQNQPGSGGYSLERLECFGVFRLQSAVDCNVLGGIFPEKDQGVSHAIGFVDRNSDLLDHPLLRFGLQTWRYFHENDRHRSSPFMNLGFDELYLALGRTFWYNFLSLVARRAAVSSRYRLPIGEIICPNSSTFCRMAK